MTYALGLIGGGNMAEAIARAAIAEGVLTADQMIVADPSQTRCDVLADIGMPIADENAQVIKQSEQVLLAVKPQMASAVTGDLAAHLRDDQIVISIMAGIGSVKLASAIGKATRIVRVMPNTPLMANCGMAGVSLGQHAQPGDDDLTMHLFDAGGSRAIRVPEVSLDAITAISGSGPAYLFYLAEAMTRAAEQLGLGEHARTLVSQTLLGAARLLDESPDTPADLRRKVTSPGGTTQAAIQHMEQNQMQETIIAAIQAAEARSKELGN
jgi:pyrroline-5-carboxylate reductase